jgi:hypothetical protein
MKVDGIEYCDVCKGSIIDERWMRTPAGKTICSECLGPKPTAQVVATEAAPPQSSIWTMDILHPRVPKWSDWSSFIVDVRSSFLKIVGVFLYIAVWFGSLNAVWEAGQSHDKETVMLAGALFGFLTSTAITWGAVAASKDKSEFPAWAKAVVWLLSYIATLIVIWMLFPVEYTITPILPHP